MYRLSQYYWLALLGLVACQNSATPNPTSAPTAALIEPTAAIAEMALATAPPRETATVILMPLELTAVATMTSLPSATATQLPSIRLGLPDWLTPRDAEIKMMLAEFGAGFGWEVRYLSEPASAWQLGELDMMLSTVVGDVPAGQRPLAITAPFVLPIEGVSQTGIEQIMAGADPRLTIQPWSEMPVSSKALRIDGLLPDDPGYPVNESYFLKGRAEFARVMGPLAAQISTLFQEQPLIHLAFTGDIMLDRALGYAINVQNDLAYPFAFVTEQLQAADITIGNLESALGDTGQAAPKAYTFQAPPRAAESMAMAGFDIVSLANNHGMDYGAESLLQGMELLQAQGVVPIGAGIDATAARAPYIIEQNGQKLAFLAYVNVPIEVSGFDTRVWEATENMAGLAWATPEIVTADISAIRDQVDHVIIVLHSGYEYQFEPSPPQQAVSQAAIEAGATLVVGHHAHVLQGVEYYGEGVIIYGLGNFAFEIDGDPRTAILNLWLDADGVRQIEFVPAVIQFGGQPRPSLGDEAAGTRNLVYMLTHRLNPGVFAGP